MFGHSVVIPEYRSSKCLPKLVKRLERALGEVTPYYEVILVDDCSPYDSWQAIKSLCCGSAYILGIPTDDELGASRGDHLRDQAQLGMPESFRQYDINWVLKQAYGTELHYGTPEGELNRERYEHMRRPGVERIYMMRDFRDTEQATLLEIETNTTDGELSTYWRYMTGDSATRAEWLRNLVRIKTTPIEIDWEQGELKAVQKQKNAA